jgi:glycosyltransferase involved in cell wall biosynthesis
MAAVTAIVLTKNVASRIERTLESLKWSEEILVVDSGSTDGTVDLCRRYTQNILEHPYESYARQQNFALDHVQTEWVFLCDADEEVPSELADEIRRTLKQPEHDGYYLYRDNYFFGKRIRHLGWGSDEVMRLFRKDSGRFEDKSVHPTVRIEGSTGWLRNRIRHEPYPTLEEYLEK